MVCGQEKFLALVRIAHRHDTASSQRRSLVTDSQIWGQTIKEGRFSEFRPRTPRKQPNLMPQQPRRSLTGVMKLERGCFRKPHAGEAASEACSMHVSSVRSRGNALRAKPYGLQHQER